jgi:uncharacterized protein
VNKALPSEVTALRLLEEAGCSKSVIQHCKVVATFAGRIAERCVSRGIEVDINLVRIGALLHDIGRAKTHDVDHAIVGAKIAKNYGLNQSIISIIQNHLGTGITKKEAVRLGFPRKNYIPTTIEERIVAYSDKMVVGSNIVPFNVALNRFSNDVNVSEISIERLRCWNEEFQSCLD